MVVVSKTQKASPSRASNKGPRKKNTAGDKPAILRRVYKVPLRVPKGKDVDKNWALVSAMLQNTVDMPIGNADFWNEPFSTLLKNVQLSKSNKKKFKEVLTNGKKKVCPKSCKKRESESLMHPQRYIYLYRLKTHLSLLNSKIRNAMEKQGFRLYKPTPEEEERRRKKVKKVTDTPKLLDPSTGEVLSKNKTQEVVEVARDDNNDRNIPEWMKNFPGIRKKKPRDESTMLKASKPRPGAFFGTPYRVVRRQKEIERNVAKKVNNALYGTGIKVANGMSVTGTGDTFYIPVKFREDQQLNDSGFVDDVSEFEGFNNNDSDSASAMWSFMNKEAQKYKKKKKNARNITMQGEGEYDGDASSS
nr:MAG: hypothetical protein [Penaeus monodon endogenous nimavirus]